MTTRARPDRSLITRATLWLALVMQSLLGCAGAWGQDSRGSGEVDVRLVTIGLGKRPRCGEWAGILVAVKDLRADKPRELLVRADMRDPDGDTLHAERAMTSKPGAEAAVWLYGRLGFAMDGTLPISVYESLPVEDSNDPAQPKYRAGKLLGRASVLITTSTQAAGAGDEDKVLASDSRVGLIAVVGNAPAGLEQYAQAAAGGVRGLGVPHSAAGHEYTEIISGLRPTDLPDRWMGLAAYEAIVWTAQGAGGEPKDLGDLRVQALREWISRGGHFIVVLPPTGQSWLGRRDSPLADLMPSVQVTTIDKAPLGPFRPILARSPAAALSDGVMINLMSPDEGAEAWKAITVLPGPEGSGDGSPVMRRLHGCGMITMIGLDLSHRAFRQEFPGAEGRPRVRAIEAEQFWNRILGKRIEVPSIEEMKAATNRNYENRQIKYFDRDLATVIKQGRGAAGGLLLALVVFVAYWLIAGPVGFLVLKRRKAKHHSWVGFVTAAAAFTGIAWGGANVLRPRTAEVWHLSFLDHIYGQTNERVRAWADVVLPRYGTQVVGYADHDAKGTWHNTISPWEAPPSSGYPSSSGSFPDARGYSSDSRGPGTLAVPSRATSKQFQLDWAGVTKWTTLVPKGADGAKLGDEIRIVPKAPERPGDRDWVIEGGLENRLPGDLLDVVIVVNRKQQVLSAQPREALVGQALAVSKPVWTAGEFLDLEAMFHDPKDRTARMSAFASREFFKRITGQPGTGVIDDERSGGFGSADLERLTALAFFDMLEPPQTQSSTAQTQAQRQATHGLDLSRWMTEPCIIVVGRLATPDIPAPLTVDGEPVKASKGTTFVRWVYPLASDPPEYPVGVSP